MVSLTQLQEIPSENMILLAGPPGAGKSAFCEQVILKSLAVDRPIIYVTTERDASKAKAALRERGLGEIETGLVGFVDAYSETVGLLVSDEPYTVRADSTNLSSIEIAISKLQERVGKKGILLVFDSLTSPYLLSGAEVLRFMRLTLSRFAGEGNSVLVCFDEGASKEEDLVAMMSLSNGVIKIETSEDKQVLNIVKHPKMRPAKVEVIPTERIQKFYNANIWNPEVLRNWFKSQERLRAVMDRFKTNIFWPNFAFWSATLSDPKRFPEMSYEIWKNFGNTTRDLILLFPWHMRLLFKSMLPKSVSHVKDAKKYFAGRLGKRHIEMRGDGIIEYLEDISRTDEHYVRLHENRECCGFESIGTTMASILPSLLAGMFRAVENIRGFERDWNAIETKCIGLGDPYCEFRLAAGEIPELRSSLEKDSMVVEKIHHHMISRVIEFLVDGKTLVERPRLGSDFLMAHPDISLPAMSSEKYRMALRIGGAKSGREVGECLIKAGMSKDEATKRILGFVEYCKVGEIVVGETIKVKESRESMYTNLLTKKWEEPSCYFLTGFLNGFFSAVKDQHVKETKCIAMGDPYCEWVFR